MCIFLEPIIQSVVSQKEKDKYGVTQSRTQLKQLGSSSSSNAYIWNLERWYRRTYLQGSSGETDIENILMDMERGEKTVRCLERVTWKLTLPYVK